MQKKAIIIPCYNEEKRLNQLLITEVLNTTNLDVYLSNDGSSDKTLEIIEAFSRANEERCFVIDFNQNQGKAATIFKSVNLLLEKNKYDYIGYFDADFSTPPTEIIRIVSEIDKQKPGFIFGSRILILNTFINRKWHRHIIGRIILTLINFKFKIGIYDTQCGAKFFSKEIASVAFKNKFHTSWLFDVEVFLRLKKNLMLNQGIEFPLKHWEDVDGSKLGWKTSFKIFNELTTLYRKY